MAHLHEILIEFLKTASAIVVALIAAKWEYKKRKAKEIPDLSEIDLAEKAAPALQKIFDEHKPACVLYFEGSNGVKTLSGFHLKKISCIEEIWEDGRTTIDQMQQIPTVLFRRNISKLQATSDDYIISDETKFDDSLAKLHFSNGIATIAAYKIYSKNKWTGLCVVGWKENIETIDPLTYNSILFQVARLHDLVNQK